LTPAAQAPFRTDILELSRTLGTSHARKLLLQGLIHYRAAVRNLGFANGYQVLDGSFCEDCELIRGSDPGDIDVITFVSRPAAYKSDDDFKAFVAANVALLDPEAAKAAYKVHSFLISEWAICFDNSSSDILLFIVFTSKVDKTMERNIAN
jgi:hypothetical protein